MKKALITGISGQDGYFLSQILIKKGYEVHGIVCGNNQSSLGTISKLDEKLKRKILLHCGDVTDNHFINNVVEDAKFHEIYHLAAQSFVALSFENPKLTYDVNIGGTLNIVNAVKDYSPSSKLYFAATSELFGRVQEIPQKENTAFYPRSPYGVSKLAGFWTVKNYRESYDLFMCGGILFNHESEVRGPEFVTRKITIGIANIIKGTQKYLELGNIDAKRDWGYSKDYVYGMWLILQQKKPDDFILATGKSHSVREFVEEAFKVVNINIKWKGKGVREVGVNEKTGKVLVKINSVFYRPLEVDVLLGDASKARKVLRWEPKVSFKRLVKIMVESEFKQLKCK